MLTNPTCGPRIGNIAQIDNIFRHPAQDACREDKAFRTPMEAGFGEVLRMKVNESRDPMLAGHDQAEWAAHTVYVDAIK